MQMHEFMDRMETAFPGSVVDEDLDGQLIIYTNLRIVTPLTNPSIPEGEVLIVPFED